MHRCLSSRALQHYNVLHHVARVVQRLINDLLQARVFALAIGNVGGKHQFRAARLNAIAQCFRAKTREHHGVDGANTHRSQHQDDGFGTGRHVYGQPIAFVDAHAPQRCRNRLDLVQQVRVGVEPALAAFVEVDQGRVPAPAALHVIIKRVVGQVGLCADEPLEGRRSPFQHPVPLAKPGQLLRRASPKAFRILFAFVDPLLHHRTHQLVRYGMQCVFVSRCCRRHFSHLCCAFHDEDTPCDL